MADLAVGGPGVPAELRVRLQAREPLREQLAPSQELIREYRINLDR